MPPRKVCVVGFHESYPAFRSLLSILSEILGTDNKVELRSKRWTRNCPSLLKIPLFVLEDICLSVKLLLLFSRWRIAAIVIFQGHFVFLPITSRLLGIRSILYLGGSAFKTSYQENPSLIARFLAFSNIPVQIICQTTADRIAIPSKSMIKWLELEKQIHKIRPAVCVVDSDFFKTFGVHTAHEKRKNVIGYVGEITKGKGLINLVKAASLIRQRITDTNLRVLIIGSGSLFEFLERRIAAAGLSSVVVLTGHRPHKSLTKYYNSMKLLVLPSYTEGLPSVVLEAMACGTPVLTTKVGAIPFLVREGENGFLLDSNQPTRIAQRVIELLGTPELMERTSENARNYVVRNFSHEKTVKAWQRILRELGVI